MVNTYSFNTKCLKIRARQKSEHALKALGNRDFDVFINEMGVACIGSFSNQTEYDVICHLYLSSSFSFQQLFISAITLFRKF